MWMDSHHLKGGAPPPTHIFGAVARDYISETTVAISIKQGTAYRLYSAWPVRKFLSLKVKTGKKHVCVNVQPSG